MAKVSHSLSNNHVPFYRALNSDVYMEVSVINRSVNKSLTLRGLICRLNYYDVHVVISAMSLIEMFTTCIKDN